MIKKYKVMVHFRWDGVNLFLVLEDDFKFFLPYP